MSILFNFLLRSFLLTLFCTRSCRRHRPLLFILKNINIREETAVPVLWSSQQGHARETGLTNGGIKTVTVTHNYSHLFASELILLSVNTFLSPAWYPTAIYSPIQHTQSHMLCMWETPGSNIGPITDSSEASSPRRAI